MGSEHGEVITAHPAARNPQGAARLAHSICGRAARHRVTEARRCLKRYLARKIYRALEHPPQPTAA
jgi:hypothetical protein